MTERPKSVGRKIVSGGIKLAANIGSVGPALWDAYQNHRQLARQNRPGRLTTEDVQAVMLTDRNQLRKAAYEQIMDNLDDLVVDTTPELEAVVRSLAVLQANGDPRANDLRLAVRSVIKKDGVEGINPDVFRKLRVEMKKTKLSKGGSKKTI